VGGPPWVRRGALASLVGGWGAFTRLLATVGPWYERSVRSSWVTALLILGVAGLGGCGDDVEVVEEPPEEVPGKSPPAPRVAPSLYTRVEVCPERLVGIETVDRVIPQDCGPVRIDATYRLDAGSLTVEPGVVLEFEAGAELALGFLKTTKVALLGSARSPVIMRPAPPEEPDEVSTEPRGWPGIRLYKGASNAVIEHVILESVGDPDRGAIYIESQGVTIEEVEMRGVAGLAVYVNSKGSLRSFAGNRIRDLVGPTSMFLPAASMRALKDDNELPAGSSIRLLGDHLRGVHRWVDPGVPVIIGGRVEIAGTRETPAEVTFGAGLELHFDEGGYINVGYYDPGVLVVEGRADSPVLLTSHGGRGPGAWRGVNLYKHASASFSHTVFEHGARYVDRGVLYANSEAGVALRDVTFRDNRSGIVLYHDKIQLEAFTGVRFERTPRPLMIDPEVFAAVGAGNSFGGERVIIDEGVIERDTVWNDAGAPVELRGPIAVEGATLTLSAGLELMVRDGFGLEIGKLEPAALRVAGEKGRPVQIFGLNDRRGTWDAIHLYGGLDTPESELRGLRLRNAGGDAAVFVHADARAKIDDVTCIGCFSPTLTWECSATVEVGAIEATGGTPRAVARPQCGG